MKVIYITVIISRHRTRVPCKDAMHAAKVHAALRRQLGQQEFISEPLASDPIIQDESEARRAEILLDWSRDSEA